MRVGRTFVVVVAVLAGVVVPAGAAVAGPAGCSWQLDRVLPLPAGYPTSAVAGADSAGAVVVGTAIDTSVFTDFQAVLWRDGRLVELPTPAGFSSSAAAVNTRGDVVGVVFQAGPFILGPNRPVLWRGGRMIELAVPAGAEGASPADINSVGLIVGAAADAGTAEPHPVAWAAALPSLVRRVPAPGRFNSALAVTEQGVVAGFGSSPDLTHTIGLAGTVAGLHEVRSLAAGDFTAIFAADGPYYAGDESSPNSLPTAVLWHNGIPRALSAQPSAALGVNARGDATGNSLTDFHPVVWSGGTEQPLPLGADYRSGAGGAISEDGATIAGNAVLAADQTVALPVLWRCA